MESTRSFIRVPLSPDGCLFHPVQRIPWSLLTASSFPGQRTLLNAVLIPSEHSTVSLKPFSALVRYFRDFPRLSEPSQSLSLGLLRTFWTLVRDCLQLVQFCQDSPFRLPGSLLENSHTLNITLPQLWLEKALVPSPDFHWAWKETALGPRQKLLRTWSKPPSFVVREWLGHLILA